MGNRRGSTRNANAKSKCVLLRVALCGSGLDLTCTPCRLAAEGRSGSPLVPSENGYLSDDGKTKAKGKSKAKRTGMDTFVGNISCPKFYIILDEAEFNLGTKRVRITTYWSCTNAYPYPRPVLRQYLPPRNQRKPKALVCTHSHVSCCYLN